MTSSPTFIGSTQKEKSSLTILLPTSKSLKSDQDFFAFLKKIPSLSILLAHNLNKSPKLLKLLSEKFLIKS
jgi:hypothetical protein